MTTSVLTTAFLLRTHSYGESDRIVTFITEDFGKVSGIAKGAKRSQRRFAGTLEPFVKVRLAFRQRPRSELAFIERCDLLQVFPGFGSDLDRFACGSYIMELTDRLVLGREPGGEIFRLVDTILAMIDELGSRATLLRAFELHLLEATGYRPELQTCRVCGSPVTAAPAAVVVPARGGVCCLSCRPTTDVAHTVSGSSLAALAGLQAQPLAAAGEGLQDEEAAAAESVLEGLIDHIVTRPLRSRAVLSSLRQPLPVG